MDFIFIDAFRLPARVGVHPREQAMPQMVEISLRLSILAGKAGSSDKLSDTIDYAQVIHRLRKELSTQHFKLLEKLAETIANLLLDEFFAAWVRVSVAKLGALPDVERVGIVIERGNKKDG